MDGIDGNPVWRSSALRGGNLHNEFRLVQEISKGAYGDVFLAERLYDGTHVCVKQVDLQLLSPIERQLCVHEARVLQSLPRHSHIIALLDVFWDIGIEWNTPTEAGSFSRPSSLPFGQHLVLILEYADAGDLDSCHIQQKYVTQDTSSVLSIFAQIVSGVEHLHTNHILHRDIKATNVFCFQDGRVVLGDFGISKSLASTEAMAHTFVGTPLSMSPEVLEDQPYSFPSDIWALGCLLYELLTKTAPFKAGSYPAVVMRITSGTYAPLPLSVPVGIRNLIASMLSMDPQQRPRIHEVRACVDMILSPSLIPPSIISLPESPGSLQQLNLSCIAGTASLDEVVAVPDMKTQISESPPLPPPAPEKVNRQHPTVAVVCAPSRGRLNNHRQYEQQQRGFDNPLPLPPPRFLSCIPQLAPEASIPISSMPSTKFAARRFKKKKKKQQQQRTRAKGTPIYQPASDTRLPPPIISLAIVGVALQPTARQHN